ncbi:glycosyltransferase [Paenibacillus sp. TRM 82003]|nr:glycosyltransferase [Paenibacillus sp. TRM 82003]
MLTRIRNRRRNRKSKEPVEEVLAVPKSDRRLLSSVPDPENIRMQADRRGKADSEPGGRRESDEMRKMRLLGLRYLANFEVRIAPKGVRLKRGDTARAVDVSVTGLLIESAEGLESYKIGDRVKVRFHVPPGTMPEGFESRFTVEADVVRQAKQQAEEGEKQLVGLQFVEPLTSYVKRKRWGYSIYLASSLMFFTSLLIILMRVESFLFFKNNMFMYLYSIAAATFLLSRYLFGSLYRSVPINLDYTPGVTIVIPCFNEEQWIHRTVASCMNQNYPLDRLEVVVVDDRSTDRSKEEIEKVVERIHSEADRFQTKERLRYYTMPENGGKREALMEGVRMAKHDLIVFVDSDSFLDPTAILHLVQPFQDPKMGGVSGRTDVENKFTNFITKLQSVRYYIAFRIIKAAESWFDSVTCLSGPLSCYRKELVLQHADAWLNQKFLGQPATFGDDRSMTNYILRTHRTGYQDAAVCSTIVPSSMRVFLKQQMRWKRSWLRESLRAATFIWRKEPFMALFFYVGLVVPIAAPVVVLYNLLYVPLTYGIFPGTFLMGLLLMAMMMSLAHMFFRQSRLWIYGVVFCVFYEFVLLWQMPIAWVTFWKSTWGTRETPQDIEDKRRKAVRRQRWRKRLRTALTLRGDKKTNGETENGEE